MKDRSDSFHVRFSLFFWYSKSHARFQVHIVVNPSRKSLLCNSPMSIAVLSVISRINNRKGI